MRTIKFRAWDKEKGIFYTPKEINELIAKLDGQEFTGLLDKNGKEIYEGDIVNYYHEGQLRFQNVIEYHYGKSVIPYSHFVFMDFNDMEVVGNIRENPDLLNN